MGRRHTPVVCVAGAAIAAVAFCWQHLPLSFLPPDSSRGALRLPPERGGRAAPLKYADDSNRGVILVDRALKPAVGVDQWYLGHPRREVDRDNLHPFFKLGLIDDEAASKLLEAAQSEGPLAVPSLALAALSAGLVALLLVLAAPVLVPLRKAYWASVVDASQYAHRIAFQSALDLYRHQQRALVDRLIAARAPGAPRDPALPPEGARSVVAVTMATGQEGSAIVRELVTNPRHVDTVVRALVRDPNSAKSLALRALSPRVELVTCDSTDVASLRQALDGVRAVYLCTTLNAASAGTWTMAWDGGQYELKQGEAFTEAARAIPTLKQILYGTAPMRKWPNGYHVEPPIHYACKWQVEDMIVAAGLPLTCLRKCPYHENFTKLTKLEYELPSPSSSSSCAPTVKAGNYSIKALTPPDFQYNMIDPRDVGPWAAIALEQPSLLVGESLSVASDCLSGSEMASEATASGAFGDGVHFEYREQPRWLFEALAYVEPTFVYISGLQRWNSDGGAYDLEPEDVARLRKLHQGTTWSEHLRREGLEQFTATMADLLPDASKAL